MKKAFLNFLEESESSPRWNRDGVYEQYDLIDKKGENSFLCH